MPINAHFCLNKLDKDDVENIITKVFKKLYVDAKVNVDVSAGVINKVVSNKVNDLMLSANVDDYVEQLVNNKAKVDVDNIRNNIVQQKMNNDMINIYYNSIVHCNINISDDLTKSEVVKYVKQKLSANKNIKNIVANIRNKIDSETNIKESNKNKINSIIIDNAYCFKSFEC